MAFTDDDLKRMKSQYCSGHPSERDEVIEALLARLEAAERLCKPINCNCAQECDSCSDALRDWRKAAEK